MVDVTRSYVVCATPRSGSTLLCELLKGTGVAGRPEEYFEARPETGLPAHPGDYLDGLPRTGAGIRDDTTPPRAPEYSSLVGLESYRRHLERTFRAGTTSNGVFGTKLMWRHVQTLGTLAGSLPEFGGLGTHDLLTSLLRDPRYVWMTRNDKLRQAISLWRALQTRQWRLDHHNQDAPAVQLQYSFEGIDHLVNVLHADDAAWREHFDAHGIRALTVVYEDDLESDQTRTVEAVLAHIGIAPPAAWRAPIQMQRQADELSDAWAEAYDGDGAARRESEGPAAAIGR